MPGGRRLQCPPDAMPPEKPMNRPLKTLMAAAVIALASLSGAAHAQSYPSRPVTLMVPYPAGGLSDVIARQLERQMGMSPGPIPRNDSANTTPVNLAKPQAAMILEA